MKRQQVFVIWGVLCAGILFAIILVNVAQLPSISVKANATLPQRTTDSLLVNSTVTVTASFSNLDTAWINAQTVNPPLPPPETPATAQILETATAMMKYSTQLAVFGTAYVKTPTGLRTPATLWFGFDETLDLTKVFSSPTSAP